MYVDILLCRRTVLLPFYVVQKCEGGAKVSYSYCHKTGRMWPIFFTHVHSTYLIYSVSCNDVDSQ